MTPAFGEITTACNVGQAKKGHGACLKSGQLVYARFHTHSHRCCREMYFNSRLDIKFGQSEWSMKCRSRAPGQGACFKSVPRTNTMQGFIFTTTTASEK